ncbi:hypothetical protein F5Y01DRAFT_40824 [Xylaria sp. FL0043]|nr:hypothetical protein F5Y01DRAFT_40824 [Xylaria sp. FL0043]
MEMTTKEEALARRRTQNREAQRRFRWKQSRQKEEASAAASRSEQQRATTIDFDMPSENFAHPIPDDGYRTDGCFITSGLRLFGNYTLLDSFNMQGCAASDEVLQVMNNKDVDMPTMLTPPESELHSARATATPPHQMREERQTPQSRSREHTRIKSSTIPETGKAQHTPRSGVATQSPSNKAQGWMSSLHIAAQNGNDRIVRMLLRHQSDSNERDSDGLTPLHYAIRAQGTPATPRRRPVAD